MEKNRVADFFGELNSTVNYGSGKMANTKPWEISNLSIRKDLSSSSKIILNQRLGNLLSSINLYLTEINPKNLHDIRISLRRVRYSMELFLICFNRKKYMSFYKMISQLQDLSGEARDLDIFKQNISAFSPQHYSYKPKLHFGKIEEKQERLLESLKIGLMKFVHSKELKEFKKLINYHL